MLVKKSTIFRMGNRLIPIIHRFSWLIIPITFRDNIARLLFPGLCSPRILPGIRCVHSAGQFNSQDKKMCEWFYLILITTSSE